MAEQNSSPYTVTAWDIYNLATRKAQQSKASKYTEGIEYWTGLAKEIKRLTTEFNETK